MNSNFFYPSKLRFYSPGRTEVWKRFRPCSSIATTQENIQKIRGTILDQSSLEINSTDLKELPIKLTKNQVLDKILNAKQKEIKKTNRKVVIIEDMPERYTYGNCFAHLDLRGKTFIRDTSVVKERGKKTRNLYFRLPVVRLPVKSRIDSDS